MRITILISPEITFFPIKLKSKVFYSQNFEHYMGYNHFHNEPQVPQTFTVIRRLRITKCVHCTSEDGLIISNKSSPSLIAVRKTFLMQVARQVQRGSRVACLFTLGASILFKDTDILQGKPPSSNANYSTWKKSIFSISDLLNTKTYTSTTNKVISFKNRAKFFSSF